MSSRWRDYASKIISEVLAKYPEEGPEQRKALREAYPFGPRKYHPYKVWLDEIKRQRAVLKWKERALSTRGALPIRQEEE
jgi:hypothetical protein